MESLPMGKPRIRCDPEKMNWHNDEKASAWKPLF